MFLKPFEILYDLKLPLKVVRLAGQNIEERADPMARVFPKMTKCTFHKWGQIVLQGKFSLHILLYYLVRSQVWAFRNHCQPRRPLHSPDQHNQREDLCFPLVRTSCSILECSQHFPPRFWFLLLVIWTSVFLSFRATTIFSRSQPQP